MGRKVWYNKDYNVVQGVQNAPQRERGSMFCRVCFAPLPEDARVCTRCGAPLRPLPWHSRGMLYPALPRPRRRRVTVLVALTLFTLQYLLALLFSGFAMDEPNLAVAQTVGLVPTLVLMVYIYCLDTLDKEPIRLLAALFLTEGIVCQTAVLAAELTLNTAFAPLADENSALWRLADALFLVALVEELGKYLVLKALTWRHRAFNYRFDGIVYAAATALGFAAFENFGYVARFGLRVALSRSITAVPGHCIDGILMGLFYGQSKVYATRGERRRSALWRVLAVLAPTLEHGLYDFAAGSASDGVQLIFYVYALTLNAVVFTAVWRLAQKDEAVALGAA